MTKVTAYAAIKPAVATPDTTPNRRAASVKPLVIF
jgi:hypothetical protein